MFGLLDFHKGCLSDTSKKINKEEILKLREITTCDYYFLASKLHLRNCNPLKKPPRRESGVKSRCRREQKFDPTFQQLQRFDKVKQTKGSLFALVIYRYWT